jgi:dihydroflavonol-4-reductase
MIALVTGGTGMLGSRIAKILASRGDRVVVTYRPGDTTAALDGIAAEHRPADLLDPASLEPMFRGVDVVFHTAALVTFDPGLYDVQMRVNLDGTKAVISACRRTGVRRMIHTSTVNTLGIPAPGTLGHEGTPFDWAPWRLGYMDSKKAAEDAVVEACRDGLDAVCVLPGTLFGPGDAHFNAGSYIRAAARGLLLAAPPGGVTAAHVDDVALGHLLALERGRTGERYILGGGTVSYRDLFGLIAREVGGREPLFTIPESVLMGAGWAGSFLRDRLGIPCPAIAGVSAAACAGLYYSSAKARRELGWEHRPVAEGVRDAIGWYRERGMI